MSDPHLVPDREADAQPLAATPPVRNPHLVGIGLFLVAIVLINCSDAAAQLTIDAVTVFQVTFVQGLGLIACGFLAARSVNVVEVMRTASWKLQILRSSCQLGSALCYYKGLQELALADTVAIILTGPLVVTAMAALVLKEKVGPRRWAACAVGLVGALVIIRPGLDTMGGLGWAAAWPLGCVLLYGVYVIVTRHLAPRDRTSTLMVWGTSVSAVVLLAAAPWYWVWPDLPTALGLLAVAVLSGTSNGLRIRSLAYAPAAVLAPFGYAEIVGGTALGLIVFGTFPDAWSWVGIAVIVASGLYVWYRERRAAG